MIWDRKRRMLLIRTYVSPAKASEEVALMKAEMVNTKPKTLMTLSENLNSFSLKQIFHNSFNKWYRRGEKKKVRSHMDLIFIICSMWMLDGFPCSLFLIFFLIGKSPLMTKTRQTLKWVRYLSVSEHWQMGLHHFHLHTTGWLLSQGLVMAFSLGLIQKKQVQLFKLGNTEKLLPKIRTSHWTDQN